MFEPHNSCARARIALSNQLGILDRYTHDVPPSVDTSQTARSACQAAEYYAMNQFRSISNAFGMSPTSGNATRLAWANVRMCQLNEDCRFGTEFARIMRDHTEAQLAYINSIRHVSTCAIAQLRLEVTNECEGESTFPVFSWTERTPAIRLADGRLLTEQVCTGSTNYRSDGWGFVYSNDFPGSAPGTPIDPYNSFPYASLRDIPYIDWKTHERELNACAAMAPRAVP